MTNTQSLGKILTKLENLVSIDTAQRMQAHRSGQSPKISHEEAKQAILQWAADITTKVAPYGKREFRERIEEAWYDAPTASAGFGRIQAIHDEYANAIVKELKREGWGQT